MCDLFRDFVVQFEHKASIDKAQYVMECQRHLWMGQAKYIIHLK